MLVLASLLAVAAAVPLLAGRTGPILDDAASGRDNASGDRLGASVDRSGRSEGRSPTATSAVPPSAAAPPAAATVVPTSTAVPTAMPAVPAASGAEGQVLALVNQARAAAGCGSVSADPRLAGVARAHSADMRDRDFFAHDNPDGLGPFDRADAAGATNARAENIAQGQPDAASVMKSWLNSPGHRRNISNCSYRTMGLGVAAGSGGPWWTQMFGV